MPEFWENAEICLSECREGLRIVVNSEAQRKAPRGGENVEEIEIGGGGGIADGIIAQKAGARR